MFYNMISLNICGLKKETTTYNEVKSIYFLCPIAFYFFEFAKPMFQFRLYPIYVIFLGRLTSSKGLQVLNLKVLQIQCGKLELVFIYL